MMGFIIGIETITGQEIPFWFTNSDSKALRHQLLTFEEYDDEPLYKIANHFHLNLEALSQSKIVYTENETLEDIIAMYSNNQERIEDWHKRQAQREAAWQSPKIIVNTLTLLINTLESHPDIFSDLKIEDPYFTHGSFRQDALDMVKMLEWCITNKIEKVRITLV
ncbi:MAG: hypothetical protein QM730_04145 [Anaerolineales bacterium]